MTAPKLTEAQRRWLAEDDAMPTPADEDRMRKEMERACFGIGTAAGRAALRGGK